MAARTIVITGVGRAGQLGEAVADAFAAQGASVVAVGHSFAEVEERASAIRARGQTARAFACDLTDVTQVDALVRDVAHATDNRVDALVNLAGGFAMSGPVAESDPAVWSRQFALNATSAYLATRGFLPMLRAARGCVVFVASVAALPGASVAKTSAYVASKSAVLTLMRAVAAEEMGVVRANAVAPTSIRTGANLAAMGDNTHYVEREAVADAIMLLSSDAARAISGEVIALR